MLPKTLLRHAENPGNPLIMILGASDTGKTTLVEALANHLAKKFKTSIVDCDMGQSHLGPPTAIAWAPVPRQGFSDWESLSVKGMFFVGALSPVGNLLPTCVGAYKMCEEARRFSQKVIVDTTGLVSEPHGRILKQTKIDLLQPDVVVALEKVNELESILKPYLSLGRPRIFRLRPPQKVRAKSGEARAHYRERKFQEFFRRSRRVLINLKRTPCRFLWSHDNEKPDLKYRLVSIRDDRNHDVAVGFVEAWGRQKAALRISPPKVRKVRYLLVGEETLPVACRKA